MVAHRHRHLRKVADDDARAVTLLARDLTRCRTRARRLWKSYQAVDEQVDSAASAKAHQAWSDSVDEALRISEAMSRQQARQLAELAIQFEAVWWWIVEDDSVLDGSARRWLSRFRRSLRRLAAMN